MTTPVKDSSINVPKSVTTTRISFSFPSDGAHAACLVSEGGSRLALEQWSLLTAERRTLLTGSESTFTQVLCISDGRIVMTRPGAERHRVVVVEPDGTDLVERGSVSVECKGLRLMDTTDPDTLALVVGTYRDGTNTIWRMRGPSDNPWLERATELSGFSGKYWWLDAVGHRIAFNQRHDGASRPVELDVRDGSLRPLPGTSSGQVLLLVMPQSDLLLLAEPDNGQIKLGRYNVGDRGGICSSTALDQVDGAVVPLAADPSGSYIAVRAERGARTGLAVYAARQDLVREVEIPDGVIHGAAVWSARGLSFPFSTPTQPIGVATISDPAQSRQQVSGWHFVSAEPTEEPRFSARVCQFDGPGGKIEAVVYGGSDWREAPHLVMALHGGPEAAVRMAFDPLFHTLANAGITVVAPNYRGSTGYGPAHQMALRDAWGGPDLADIRQIAQELARHRCQQLMIYGSSYGAFLALLAAGADPELWSHCVAVAPFISGPRLYDQGSARVRALLDRLGGRTPIRDALGPRDVTRFADRLTARVMIIHGRDDEVIPVGQSRELRDIFWRLGRRDVDYREVAGGHDLSVSAAGSELAGSIVDFLLDHPVREEVSR